MTRSQPVKTPPSLRQLRYLRDLAAKLGETFTYPKTKTEASAEIRRLRGRSRQPVNPHTERIAPAGKHVPVQAHEIEGYGSTARWA